MTVAERPSKREEERSHPLHEIEIQREELDQVRQIEDRLTSAQSADQRATVATAVAVGVADASAFVLTINAIGGALWLRILTSISIALVFDMVLWLVARTIAGSRQWRGVMRARVIIGLGLWTTLAALVGLSSFRAYHLDALEKGLPTDPGFLVWVGLAALVAVVGVAAVQSHCATVADRAAERARKLESQVRDAQVRLEALRAKADLCGRRSAPMHKVGLRPLRYSQYVRRVNGGGSWRYGTATHVSVSVGACRLARLSAGAVA